MKHNRRLPLEKLYNARDLGGHPTRDGGSTRYGRFIRSELPDSLSHYDLSYLRSYGVTTTLDFRATAEIPLAPSRLAAEPWLRYVHMPMWSLEASHFAAPDPKLAAQVLKSDEVSRRLGGIDWVAVYTTMAEDNKRWMRENFELIAGERGCVHFHCMTGKDRTGIFTAMLLGLADVAENDIIADYSVSQIYLRPFYLTYRENDDAFSGNPDLSLAFYRTQPEVMEGFLLTLNERYGGIRGYLESCALDSVTLETVRSGFVEM